MTKVADLAIFHEFVHFSYNMNFLAEYGTIFQFSRFFHGSKWIRNMYSFYPWCSSLLPSNYAILKLTIATHSRDIIRVIDADPRQKILGVNKWKKYYRYPHNFFGPAIQPIFYVACIFCIIHIFKDIFTLCTFSALYTFSNTFLRCIHFSH